VDALQPTFYLLTQYRINSYYKVLTLFVVLAAASHATEFIVFFTFPLFQPFYTPLYSLRLEDFNDSPPLSFSRELLLSLLLDNCG